MSTWNTAFEASPAGSDAPSLGDNNIREVKSAVRERLIKEHKMNLSSGLIAEDGWHKQGSAIIYFGASAPTTRPDGTTALNAEDYGRLWLNTGTNVLYIYTSSGWSGFGLLSPVGAGWGTLMSLDYLRTSDPSTPSDGQFWYRTDL